MPFADIWTALAEDFGVWLPAELRARYTPQDEAVLVRCEHCDLEYFSPHGQGERDFYEALMAQTSYEPGRWEFDLVAARLAPEDAVVDFGCGEGAFLQRITGSVRRAVGVDLNQPAVTMLRKRGLEAFCGRPREFAEQADDHFDVACAFQIVEHLPAVDELLEPLLARLADGGRVFVSVPNRARLRDRRLEPLDCPPHHVSRWSAKALARLADRYALQLARLDFQPASYDQVAAELNNRLEHVARRLPSRTRSLFMRAVRIWLLGPSGHPGLGRTGLSPRRHLPGHTMLAELRPRPRRNPKTVRATAGPGARDDRV